MEKITQLGQPNDIIGSFCAKIFLEAQHIEKNGFPLFLRDLFSEQGMYILLWLNKKLFNFLPVCQLYRYFKCALSFNFHIYDRIENSENKFKKKKFRYQYILIYKPVHKVQQIPKEYLSQLRKLNFSALLKLSKTYFNNKKTCTFCK